MNKSTWQSQRIDRFPRLKQGQHFDVAVIGGGITGLSAAYFLKQAGRSVCLLERDRLGSADTGHTTAHLTAVTDLRLTELEKNFGEAAAKLVWNAGTTAIHAIETIARELRIDCEFRRVPGFLHASLSGKKDESRQLRREAEVAQKLGIDARFVDAAPYVEKAGIRFADQAKFHPLAYLAGLARAVHGAGCVISENSEVDEIEADPLVVKAGKLHIECDYLVIATHVPLIGISGMTSAALFQTKLAPYSSYAIAATLPRGDYAEVSLFDTSDPYYYLRIDRGAKTDRVIFGGQDHKTGQAADTEEPFQKLTEVLSGIFPEARAQQRWSGQVIETNDGLPLIGETAERQFVATGFAGNGMTFGTLAGMMARDRVCGQDNPWQKLFSVDRKKLRGGAWDYLKENLDYPYYYLKDRWVAAEGTSTRAVARGDGKILKLDGQRVACSRDEQGKLTMLAAECTHMGCVVRWNGAEKTWDCPCHGSRFHANGEVLAGPAETPLPKAKKADAKSKKPVNGQSGKHPRRRSGAASKDR